MYNVYEIDFSLAMGRNRIEMDILLGVPYHG